MADEKTNTPPPAANDEGFLHSLATSFGLDPEAVKATAKAFYEHPGEATKAVGSEIADEASDIAAHPLETAKDIGRGVAAQITNPDAQATAKQRFAQPGAGNKVAGAIEYLESGIPLVGGNLAKGEEQAAQGNIPGAIGTTLGTVGPMVTDTEGAQAAKTAVKTTARDLATNVGEGMRSAADMALNAKAPEGSLEAGFAKVGGKKVKEPTPAPTKPGVSSLGRYEFGYMRPDGTVEQGARDVGPEKSTHETLAASNHESIYEIMSQPGGVRYGTGKENHGFVSIENNHPKTVTHALKVLDQMPTKTVDFDYVDPISDERVSFEGTPKEVAGKIRQKFQGEDAHENAEEGTVKPQYTQTLARRGQLPGQTVNMAEAYGDTGRYVGGLEKSTGEKIAGAVSPSTPSARGLKERSTGDDKIDEHIKTAGAIPAGTTVGDQVMFHDPITGSTLSLPRDQATSPEAVRAQITASREKYGAEPKTISDKLVDTYGTTDDPLRAGFILTDGRMVPLRGEHNTMLENLYNKYGDISMDDAERTAFINNEGAIRTRVRTTRGGTEVVFSVPKAGVNPEQVAALKRSVGAVGRNGNAVIEISEGEGKSARKEFVRPSDVEPMLQEIGAHPEQKTTAAPTAEEFIKTAPEGVVKADDPKAAAVKKLVEDNGGVFRGMQVNQAGDKRIGQIYIDVPPDRVGGKKNVTAGVALDKATPENIKAAVDKMAAQHAPEIAPNADLQASAQKYAKKQGMEPISHEPVKVDPERAKEIANIYHNAQHDPENPRVKAAYDAMKKETLAQFHHLRDDLGLKFEPQEQDPYSSAGEMMDDVRRNNRLKVWNQADLQTDHPLAEIAPGTGGQTYNTIFRWVHDAMGHAAGGNDFSEAGEKSATEAHAQMYSDAARPAMRNETEGQTSWFFHNPDVESGAKQPGEFPGNKATILPDVSADWHEKAGASAAKNEAGGINPRTGKSDAKGMGTEIMPEFRQPLDHAPTAQDFKNFYEQHKDIFDAHPELRVGWDNKSAVPGGHEINVGAVGPDAARVAKKLDQKSAFNIAKGEVVPTGGTGLRTSFPNYPIEERIKDLTSQAHSTRPGFEHLSDRVFQNLEPDERKYVEGDKTLQRNVMAQYHKIAPSVNETTNAMQAGAALAGWWQRYIDTFHGLLDTDAEKVAKTIGPSHAEVLKQWHAALSANKSVEDANNLAWHTYADWLDAGKPTDRKSINDIVLKNGAQPEGSAKKGNAAISDTLGKRGKVIHEGIDTSKLYNLVNSPEMRGERPFSGDVFNDDEKNPLMGKGEGYRKVPSMGATVAGKGNLNRLVIDTHIADFYGQSVKGTAARYIADSAHLREAAKALGLKGGEGQEQLWGTVLGLKTLLKEGLTPEEAGGKLNAETINKIGKDYAEVIANDPEITKPGGLLDRLKDKYGIGTGSAGAGAADSAARSTRASESQLERSEAGVDPSLLGESARRIRGQISESKIKKPAAAPPEDEDTSFNFGANVEPKKPAPAGKASKAMSAMDLIEALKGLSKPGSKK